MQQTIKWKDKDVYVHYIPSGETYALVSLSPKKIKLFKAEKSELELNGKELGAYLLEQVEERQ